MNNLQDFLKRPVAFYPALAKVLGGINEAIYLQQLMYWSDKGSRKDGFIYKTKNEIENETCLSRYQQDNARGKLKKMGVLETKVLKANGKPTLHYRVAFPKVRNLLFQTLETRFSETLETDVSITESTQESTTDITSSTAAEETTPKHNPLGAEIIEAFVEINPACKRMYGHKVQRQACDDLIEQYGFEAVLNIVKTILPKTNKTEYITKITTPNQLWTQYATWRDQVVSKHNGAAAKKVPVFM